jgi:hypothetical protein
MEGEMMRLRRWATLGLLIVVLATAGASCSDDDGGANIRSRGGASNSSTSDTSPDSYVGLSKRDAIAKAEAEDRKWRVLREDDETFPATADYIETRINFEIDDGKVTKASYG